MTRAAHPQLRILCQLITDQLAFGSVPADQWPAVADLAVQHGVAPLLYWLLKQQPPTLPPASTATLALAAHNSAINQAILERARQQVQAAFEHAGIPCIWLKGAVLARTIYPEMGLRPMTDIDVLVPYAQREAALQVAQTLHYEWEHGTSDFFPAVADELNVFSTSKHHYRLYSRTQSGVALEIHYRLLGADDDRLMALEDLQWFWQTRQTLTLTDGTRLDHFSAEAQLLHLCAHIVLQHPGDDLFLIRYLDLHRLITRSALDWSTVIDQAVALGWTFPVELALLRTVEFFATPIPDHVLPALVERRPADEDIGLFRALQGSGGRWEAWRAYLVTLPPRQRLEMMRRALFPSRDYLRERYHVKTGIMLYYPYRWLDQSRVILTAVWQRLRAR
ncbi:MAG: nucleotidyltransferase family protein [Anaerolineae bacterium]|nr:nucleotidyltransferase family protein [Anaerolineae bacterium]